MKTVMKCHEDGQEGEVALTVMQWKARVSYSVMKCVLKFHEMCHENCHEAEVDLIVMHSKASVS